MLSFLPFLHAVKAPAPGQVVCSLIWVLAAACAPPAAPHSPPAQGPSTGLRAAPGPSSAAPAIEPASSGAPDIASIAVQGIADAAPVLQIERPYPIDARPGAAGALEAAREDEELARWNAGGSSDPSSPTNQASYHPGTRVVVDTRAAKLRSGARPQRPPQGLSFERVQAQARSRGYWPFRLCFEAGQRKKKGSGGETRVAFTIGMRGNVRAARLLDSHLENAATAACLVREVLKLEFTPRPPRALAMVASIRIWPGDAELPPLPTALASDARANAPPPGGAFDSDAVRALIEAKQPDLEGCFRSARQADPALWGRLALSIILEVDGSVHRVSEVESRFPSQSAAPCVERVLSGLSYPNVNGKPFTFVVPLRLLPTTAPGPAAPPPKPVETPSSAEPPSPAPGSSDDEASGD